MPSDDDPWFVTPSPPPPRDPSHPQASRTYGDRLGVLRHCHWCGQQVRQGWWRGRVETALDIEGPYPPAEVRSTSWPAWWWNERVGFIDRVRRADHLHEAAGHPLYVMHPCEDKRHRPPAPPT